MDDLDRTLVDGLQWGFPLEPYPFCRAGRAFGLDGEALLERVRGLVTAGVFSRFGPLYHPERLGGAVTLAALCAPEAGFERLAGVVNSFPQVAHNYARGHTLNMWFVVATETPGEIPEALAAIARATGCPVYNFPKLREFYIGFAVRLSGGVATGTRPHAEGGVDPSFSFQEEDRRIVAASQAGLPLTLRPYARVAEEAGLGEEEVLRRLQRMLAAGAIRRMGGVPNHYRMGLTANGMTVWDLDDEQVEEAGREVGALPFVTHCYQRPRCLPLWRYNLFAMVHGEHRGQVEEQAARVAERLGDRVRAREILYSTRVLKKSGFRLH